MSSLLVMKFGGTSVGNAERMLNVTKTVIRYAQNNRVVVVLSAMSSYKKSEGTTSRLLEAAAEILKPDSTKYLDIVDLIEKDHLECIHGAVSDPLVAAEAIQDVKMECDKLKSFMSAAEIINEISPRSKDVIISVGEKLSARIFSAVLQSQGISSTFINLEKVVDRKYDKKAIDQTFYDYLATRLRQVLDTKWCSVTESDNIPHLMIPVVTGYLGPVPGSILATIGRGYTDLTAALIAVGLSANELQIWKEVDGIYTADPRKVPSAQLLNTISPEEAAELTYYGSEVIHPFTMEQVIKAEIPIRIKNTFKPGTVILPRGWTEESMNIKDPLTPRRPSNAASKRPTAVTIKEKVAVVNIRSNRKSIGDAIRYIENTDYGRHGIIVDLISTSEVHVSMALNPAVTPDILAPALDELSNYGDVDVLNDMAILSLVGKEMRNMVGIASKMFSTLASSGVNIEMISQGASEINISCVIEKEQAETALRAIHEECIAKL